MKHKIFAWAWLGLLIASTILVELLFRDSITRIRVEHVLEAPSFAHVFGTDALGRDLFARLVSGTKTSLSIGLIGSLIALGLGTLYGTVAGWRGGGLDRFLMRILDVLMAVPSFALVAVFTVLVQSVIPLSEGAWKNWCALILALGLTHWMGAARIVRSLVLQAKVEPYVEASRALGATGPDLVTSHIFPALAPSLAVLLGLQIPNQILYESFMSFIGLGVQSPQTSWGTLVQEGWSGLSVHPHLILFPALILFLTIWSLHSIIRADRKNTFGGL